MCNTRSDHSPRGESEYGKRTTKRDPESKDKTFHSTFPHSDSGDIRIFREVTDPDPGPSKTDLRETQVGVVGKGKGSLSTVSRPDSG